MLVCLSASNFRTLPWKEIGNPVYRFNLGSHYHIGIDLRGVDACMTEQFPHCVKVAPGSQLQRSHRMAAGVETHILFYPCGNSHLFKTSVAGTKAGHIKDFLSRLAAVSIRQPFQRRLVQWYRYLFPCLLHGLNWNNQSSIDLFYISPCQYGNIAIPQSGKAAEQECPFGCLVGCRSLD